MADFREIDSARWFFAASTDETRPVLQGVMTTIANNEVALAATDGFRISIANCRLLRPLKKPIT
jgi:DNA polymerase-3 subunit beta